MNKIVKVEILHDDPCKVKKIAEEAQEILERINIQQGCFTYHGVGIFKLDIRPLKVGKIEYGQPLCHQYATLYACGVEEDYEIARFHFHDPLQKMQSANS